MGHFVVGGGDCVGTGLVCVALADGVGFGVPASGRAVGICVAVDDGDGMLASMGFWPSPIV